jgi:hypothetical protein
VNPLLEKAQDADWIDRAKGGRAGRLRRKAVGWEVYAQESGECASELMVSDPSPTHSKSPIEA